MLSIPKCNIAVPFFALSDSIALIQLFLTKPLSRAALRLDDIPKDSFSFFLSFLSLHDLNVRVKDKIL